MTVSLMTFTPTGGEVEYLESVSRDGATTWTTDPSRAFHFFSAEHIPVTTVILRFPMIEPPKENATESQKTLYLSILKWLKEHE